MREEHWLAGPSAKLDRAVEHHKTLEHECQRFLDTEPKPYYVAVEFEPEAHCHVARFHIRKNVPLPLSVIVGELIHDLRSALEHIAWLLACRTKSVEYLWKPRVRKQVTFPIAETAEDFPKQRLIPFLCEDAQAVLKPLQPYAGEHEPEHHPLCRLHSAWNIDKHVVLHGGIGALDLALTTFVPKAIHVEDLQGVSVEWVPLGSSIEEGAPIAYIRFGGVMTEAGATQVDVKRQPPAEILFGAGGGITSIAGLGDFCRYVADVVAAVRPLSPPP